MLDIKNLADAVRPMSDMRESLDTVMSALLEHLRDLTDDGDWDGVENLTDDLAENQGALVDAILFNPPRARTTADPSKT